ncbi:MAG: shikimate dehydrogenase family protein [Culicoidibacterales bacterium]
MRRFGLLGANISYSRSPLIHQQLFQLLGHEATYELVDCATFSREQLQQFAGLNVTIPHKEQILHCVDRCDEHVQAIGATNTIVWDGDELVAHNTDWLGFLHSIEPEQWRSRKVLLLGAGGAAKAVYYALCQLTDTISIANRTYEHCLFVAPQTPILTLAEAEMTIQQYDYVVQATNQDFSWLNQAKYVYDLRYTTTNCQQNGLLMLIHQAIVAQSYFWDQPITNHRELARIIERKIKNELNK